jgi:hypothetical protein
MNKTEQVQTHVDGHGDAIDTHPAFGGISISRVETGGAFQLYGCQSNMHSSCIRIEIKRSERSHRNGADKYFSRGDHIAVVYMSLSQFSEFIISVGHVGVPCTLKCVEGKEIPSIPADDDNEIGRITKNLEKNVRNKILNKEVVVELYSKLASILDKKSIPKESKNEISSLFEQVIGLVRTKVPDAMTAFSEAAERVAQEVRKDVIGLAQDLGIKVQTDKLLGTGDDK